MKLFTRPITALTEKQIVEAFQHIVGLWPAPKPESSEVMAWRHVLAEESTSVQQVHAFCNERLSSKWRPTPAEFRMWCQLLRKRSEGGGVVCSRQYTPTVSTEIWDRVKGGSPYAFQCRECADWHLIEIPKLVSDSSKGEGIADVQSIASDDIGEDF